MELALGNIVVITRNGSLGKEYTLTKTKCTFGQSSHCDVRVHVSNVARKHCIISAQHSQPAIISNFSPSNSTLVNGNSIGGSQHELKHLDLITVGDRHFRWEYPKSCQSLMKSMMPHNPKSNQKSAACMVEVPLSVVKNKRHTIGPEMNKIMKKTSEVQAPSLKRRRTISQLSTAKTLTKPVNKQLLAVSQTTSSPNAFNAHAKLKRTSFIPASKTPNSGKKVISTKVKKSKSLSLSSKLSFKQSNEPILTNITPLKLQKKSSLKIIKSPRNSKTPTLTLTKTPPLKKKNDLDLPKTTKRSSLNTNNKSSSISRTSTPNKVAKTPKSSIITPINKSSTNTLKVLSTSVTTLLGSSSVKSSFNTPKSSSNSAWSVESTSKKVSATNKVCGTSVELVTELKSPTRSSTSMKTASPKECSFSEEPLKSPNKSLRESVSSEGRTRRTPQSSSDTITGKTPNTRRYKNIQQQRTSANSKYNESPIRTPIETQTPFNATLTPISKTPNSVQSKSKGVEVSSRSSQRRTSKAFNTPVGNTITPVTASTSKETPLKHVMDSAASTKTSTSARSLRNSSKSTTPFKTSLVQKRKSSCSATVTLGSSRLSSRKSTMSNKSIILKSTDKKKSITNLQNQKYDNDAEAKAERAAKRLKMETPKSLSKNKVAALLVCHGRSPKPLQKKMLYSDILKSRLSISKPKPLPSTGTRILPKKLKKQKTLEPQLDVPKSFKFNSTGHANSPETIVITKKLRNTPAPKTRKGRKSVIDNCILKSQIKDEDLHGVPELFKTPSRAIVSSLRTASSVKKPSNIRVRFSLQNDVKSPSGRRSSVKLSDQNSHNGDSPIVPSKRYFGTPRKSRISESSLFHTSIIEESPQSQSTISTHESGFFVSKRKSQSLNESSKSFDFSVYSPSSPTLQFSPISAISLNEVSNSSNYSSHSVETNSPKRKRSIMSSERSLTKITSARGNRSPGINLTKGKLDKSKYSTDKNASQSTNLNVDSSIGDSASDFSRTKNVSIDNSGVFRFSPDTSYQHSNSSKTQSPNLSQIPLPPSSPVSTRSSTSVRSTRSARSITNILETPDISHNSSKKYNTSLISNITLSEDLSVTSTSNCFQETNRISSTPKQQSDTNMYSPISSPILSPGRQSIRHDGSKRFTSLSNNDLFVNESSMTLDVEGVSRLSSGRKPRKASSQAPAESALTPESQVPVATIKPSTRKNQSKASVSSQSISISISSVLEDVSGRSIDQHLSQKIIDSKRDRSSNGQLSESLKSTPSSSFEYTRFSSSKQKRRSLASAYSLDNTNFDFSFVTTPKVPMEMFISPIDQAEHSVNNVTQTNSLSVDRKIGKRHSNSSKSPSKIGKHPDFEGIKNIFQHSPPVDYSDVTGVRRLLRTPKATSAQVKTPPLEGVKNLFKKEHVNDYTDVRGVKRLLKTPKHSTPVENYASVEGIKQLFKKSPVADYTNVSGVKRVLSPKGGSPLSKFDDVRGVKKLLKTPKPDSCSYANVEGIKDLFIQSPQADYTNVSGVKRLYSTTPEPNYMNVKGVRTVFIEAKSPNSPDVAGVEILYESPTKIVDEYNTPITSKPIVKVSPMSRKFSITECEVNNIISTDSADTFHDSAIGVNNKVLNSQRKSITHSSDNDDSNLHEESVINSNRIVKTRHTISKSESGMEDCKAEERKTRGRKKIQPNIAVPPTEEVPKVGRTLRNNRANVNSLGSSRQPVVKSKGKSVDDMEDDEIKIKDSKTRGKNSFTQEHTKDIKKEAVEKSSESLASTIKSPDKLTGYQEISVVGKRRTRKGKESRAVDDNSNEMTSKSRRATRNINKHDIVVRSNENSKELNQNTKISKRKSKSELDLESPPKKIRTTRQMKDKTTLNESNQDLGLANKSVLSATDSPIDHKLIVTRGQADQKEENCNISPAKSKRRGRQTKIKTTITKTPGKISDGLEKLPSQEVKPIDPVKCVTTPTVEISSKERRGRPKRDQDLPTNIENPESNQTSNVLLSLKSRSKRKNVQDNGENIEKITQIPELAHDKVLTSPKRRRRTAKTFANDQELLLSIKKNIDSSPIKSRTRRRNENVKEGTASSTQFINKTTATQVFSVAQTNRHESDADVKGTKSQHAKNNLLKPDVSTSDNSKCKVSSAKNDKDKINEEKPEQSVRNRRRKSILSPKDSKRPSRTNLRLNGVDRDETLNATNVTKNQDQSFCEDTIEHKNRSRKCKATREHTQKPLAKKVQFDKCETVYSITPSFSRQLRSKRTCATSTTPNAAKSKKVVSTKVTTRRKSVVNATSSSPNTSKSLKKVVSTKVETKRKSVVKRKSASPVKSPPAKRITRSRK